MLQNNTVKTETTTIIESTLNSYDNSGAMMYIIVVLLWYSIGIIFMLGMQMRARSEAIEESARRRTKLLIRNLRDHTTTKEILEELVDKQKRARLWDIYLGTTTNPKDKLNRAETVRIRNIEKQLATMNRNRRLTNDTVLLGEEEVRYFRSRSDSRQIIQESSTVETASTLRRRSSLDQQTLERWKALTNQSKTHEQMPWTIRKLMIGRYFRRSPKKPLQIIHQVSVDSDPIIDNLSSFTNHISMLTRHQSEIIIDRIPSLTERQNPYLTYFYTSPNHSNILTKKFFSVSSDPIVQSE
ncbi:unnamed protein product [Adineta steineri]|uniref:Uncharacterized protein n=1 Tax=Adineta steineri TaxID=433720 RepID=A0A815CZR7_9BILA|nr:unnamed protein product [Adineta steineri]CAF3777469.1 unnamed protein product [Adineta steineri]